jgi:hypothetical protein
MFSAEHLSVAGLVFAALFAVYGVLRYRGRRGSRFELLLSLTIALGVAVVSVAPQVGEVLTGILGLEQREFALISFAILLLFGLFLYLLGQVSAVRSRNRDTVIALAVRSYLEKYGTPDMLPPDTPAEEGTREKVMVLVPAYNEAKNIGDVLRRVPKQILGRETRTLVVVDGATDDTESVALREGVPTAALAVRLGKGDAMRVGFEIARLMRPEIVVTLDSDGQYKPEEIEDVMKPVVDGKADFVIGSRFFGSSEESGSVRHAGVVFFSKLISVLIRRRITDCTSGLRAIRGEGVDKLDLREEQFETNEVLLEAHRNRLRIVEVPCSMLKRAEGISKKPPKLWYPMGVMWVIVRTWLRGKPVG